MSEEKNKVRRIFVPASTMIPAMLGGVGPKAEFPYSYFVEFLLNSPVFNASPTAARLAVNVDQAYRNRQKNEEGREYFDLEQKPQPQYQAFKQAVENPGEKGYPVAGRYLLDYMDSVLNAEEVEVE